MLGAISFLVCQSPQHKKRFGIYRAAPNRLHTAPLPQLWYTTCKSATVSLQGPSSHHTRPCPGSLPETRGAVLQGRGRVWPGSRRQWILAASRCPPPGSWPAYLGRQTLRFAGEDVCSFPAAGGEVQDGSSCRYVGVFAALTVALRAGTAGARCVSARTQQPVRKFPWIGKMLRC